MRRWLFWTVAYGGFALLAIVAFVADTLALPALALRCVINHAAAGHAWMLTRIIKSQLSECDCEDCVK